jgi:hypothetical protein
MTRRAFILNVIGLSLGMLAAMCLAFWPPRIQQYTEKGEPFIGFTKNPTATGKRWGVLQEWLSCAGPVLLLLAFLLQFIALWYG